MATSVFRQALEGAIAQRHSAVHPFSEAWSDGQCVGAIAASGGNGAEDAAVCEAGIAALRRQHLGI